MKKFILSLFVLSISVILFSCGGATSNDEKDITLQLIEKNSEFDIQLKALKSQQDTTKNIEKVFAIDDQIAKIKDSATVALQKIFNGKRQALAFTQVENTDKITIDSLIITDVAYDVFTLEAKISAVQSSVFSMVYTSVSAVDKSGKKIEISGGIGIDTKLNAGEKYIFKGEIREISKLKDYSKIVFDEAIKKW